MCTKCTLLSARELAIVCMCSVWNGFSSQETNSYGHKALEFSRQVEDTLLCDASVARAMSIGVQFSPGWYALFVAFFLAWLTLALFRRKGVERKEAKEQFVLGLLGSCALVSMEIFATSTNLWTYVPQNWPVMLWPTYFVAILFGYQLLRLVEGFFSKNTPARSSGLGLG